MIPKNAPPTLANKRCFSTQLADFIARCLTKDPNRRPTALELLQDPFINRRADRESINRLIRRQFDLISQGYHCEKSENSESDQDELQETLDVNNISYFNLGSSNIRRQ